MGHPRGRPGRRVARARRRIAGGRIRAILPSIVAAGINLALGTDGTASNNDLDMLGETRTAALLAKGVRGDPAALPAHLALRMATLDGAGALGDVPGGPDREKDLYPKIRPLKTAAKYPKVFSWLSGPSPTRIPLRYLGTIQPHQPPPST